MKLRYIFTSLVAALGLMAVSCTPETQYQLSEIQVSSSYIAIPAEGGNVEITVNAQDEWEFASIIEIGKDADEKPIMAAAPAWLTITPLSGSAGETTVKFHADAAEATRETSLQISCAGKIQRISVIQMTEAAEPTILTVSEIIAMAPGLAAGTIPEQTVYVKGIVSKIDEISTSYGNATFYLSDDGTHKGSYNADGTGDANWFEVYRGYWLNGTKFTKGDEFSVGDELVVTGLLISYKGTPETNQNTASVVSITKSLISMSEPEFKTIPAEGLEFELAISSKVTPLLVTTDSDWLRVTDVKSDPKKGDIYVFTAAPNEGHANRKASITAKAPGALKSIEVTQEGVPVEGATSIAGLVEQITSTNQSSPSTINGTITGAVVSYVNGSTAYIEDASGAIKLYKSGHGLNAGDVLSGEVTGSAYVRSGVPQMTEFTGYTVATGGTIPQTEITIEALLANYDANLNRRIILKGVTISDAIASGDRNGKATQGSSTIDLYDESRNVVFAQNAKGDLIAYVSKYNTTKQLSVWQSSDLVAAGPSFAADGNFDEWAEVASISGNRPDGSSNSRIAEWKVASDNTNIYLYFKITTEKIKHDRYFYLGFDFDKNESTGTTHDGIPGLEAYAVVYPCVADSDPLQYVNGVDSRSILYPQGAASVGGVVTIFAAAADATYTNMEMSIPRDQMGIAKGTVMNMATSYNNYTTAKHEVTL